jgi:hypothetical protein
MKIKWTLLMLMIIFFSITGCGHILPNKNFSFKIDTSLNLDRKNLSFDFGHPSYSNKSSEQFIKTSGVT